MTALAGGQRREVGEGTSNFACPLTPNICVAVLARICGCSTLQEGTRDHKPSNAPIRRVFDGAPGRQYRGAGTERWIHCLLIVEHQGPRAMVRGVRRAGAVGREKGRIRPVGIGAKIALRETPDRDLRKFWFG